MSRSKHITRRQSQKRFAEGDVNAVVEYAEKRNLKQAMKTYGPIYGDIHPSEKTPRLRNSVALSAVKQVTTGNVQDFLTKQED